MAWETIICPARIESRFIPNAEDRQTKSPTKANEARPFDAPIT